MPTGNPGKPKPRWKKVEEARNLLISKSKQIAQDLVTASEVAAKKGDSRPAEFILTHITTTDDQGKEVRPLASSIDKQIEGHRSSGPTIQIGVLLPGMNMPTGVRVINVTPTPSPSESPTVERKAAELSVITGESDNSD
jgi:hypothetical protein